MCGRKSKPLVGSGGDYILAVYDRTGATRGSTPVTYNNGGTDEARWDVLGLAGAVLYTGVSHDSSTDDDFATVQHVESSDVLSPDSYDDSESSYVSGSLSDVDTSNDEYLELEPLNESSNSISMKVPFSATVETENPVELSLTVEGHVDVDHIWEKVEVYDLNQGDWVTVSDHAVASGTDENTVIVFKDDPMQYIDGDGVVQARVTYYGSAATTGWTEGGDGAFHGYFDLVQLNVLGS